ncbi:imelysin family protein [Geminicoccus harenae]|uniref:imelysin family protein n=1 Tax=Geminicoccus harenae TaxID=2498453 RepID=UPI00168AADDD|nr:imelysin family protein [Geminicoccus harenae]
MRIPIFALALLLGWPALAGAQLAEPGNAAVRAWQEAAASFDQAGSATCPEPAGPEAVERAREAFRDLVLRWQAARTWLVGPGVPADLASRVWFWPDPHGSAGRQIARSLSSGKPEGIAASGFGMAEEVLFGGTGEPEQGGCRLLRAVGDAQAELADAVAAEFTATRLSDNDRRRLLLISMRDSLDRISQEKIARPLGLDIDTARGQRAEAWRSGLSLPAIQASLAAVEAVYLAPDGVAARLAAQDDGPALDTMIRAQFGRVQAALAAIDLPLDQAVSDPAARPKVEALLTEVQQLRLLVVERLAPAIGISLGFNALDGD